MANKAIPLKVLIVFCFLIVAPITSFSDELSEGLTACKSGDWTTAARLLKPLIDRGNRNPEVLVCLSEMYFDGHGVHQDYSESLKLMYLAAEMGHADSQFRLGYMLTFMYDKRLGSIRNQYTQSEILLEAFKWITKAAENCHQQALISVNATLGSGEGNKLGRWTGGRC